MEPVLEQTIQSPARRRLSEIMKPGPPSWLKVDIAELRTTYRDLKRQLAEMEDFAARYGIELEKASSDSSVVGRPSRGAAASPGRGRFSDMTVRDAAFTVLEEAGHKLPIKELYEALIDGGAIIRGKDRKNTLYGTIQKDERLVNLGGNIWDLASRQEHGTGHQEQGPGEEL
jgi:hypothetical protein